MRKKLLLLLTIIGLALIVSSCQQDSDLPDDPQTKNWQEDVLRAREFFDMVYSPELKTRTAQHSPATVALSGMNVNPDWEYSLYSENETEVYLEFPLISASQIGIVAVNAPTPEEAVRPGEHRLVIRKNRSTGEMEMFTSLWVADDEPSQSMMPGLTQLDKADFSGRVYLFYPDGQFYQGAQFKEGVRTASLTILETGLRSGLPTRSDCVHIEHILQERYCDYKYECTEWVTVDYWAEVICDDGDGGGGGGGGDSGNNSSNTNTPNASKIFKNPNMSTENWNKLEALIEQIIDDCMGKMLYNNLSNKMSSVSPINIEFDSSISGGSFGVSGGEATIKLGAIEDHVLLHEMMHAYQNLNGNNSGSLNNEIEAWVSQYRLCSKSPDYVPGNYYYEMYTETPLGRSVQRLSDQMNAKGGLINPLSDFNAAYQNTVEWFQNTWGYHTYTYDSSVTGLNNFKNLIEFSKDC